MKKAVFLDKDGVITVDQNYDQSIESFKFIEKNIEAFRLIKEKGYLIFVISNQSGIARGYYSAEDFEKLMKYIEEELSKENVCWDKYYYCPHHPEGKVSKYKMVCNCRKPQPGMILQAQKEFDVDLSQSIMVGDRLSDLQAGKNAGIKNTYLVRSGKEVTEEAQKEATAVFDNLYELACTLN